MAGIIYFFIGIIYLQGINAKAAEFDKDGYHPKELWSGRTGHEADWAKLAQDELKANLDRKLPNFATAKNLILLIGDGMGVSTVTAARWHKSQLEGTKGYDTFMSWDRWPHGGLAKTYSVTNMTPDSAATANAFNSGIKTRSGTIGVNQNVARGNCTAVEGNEAKSFLHSGIEEGKWVGVITNTRITHATPSASYAHSADRDWENDNAIPQEQKDMCPDIKDIASQLVLEEINQNIRVILGGGRLEFLPSNMSDPEYPEEMGHREDGVNLIEEWQRLHEEQGHRYIYVDKLANFDSINAESTDFLLGLFEPSHMHYEVDREHDVYGEPSLESMVEKAIQILERAPEGFILYVEGGRIDNGHHDNNAYRANDDTYALERAAEKAFTMTSDTDTLIVVTADHSHVYTFGGTSHINEDMYALVVGNPGEDYKTADDGKPLTSMAYANGPGWYVHRNGSVRSDIRQWPEEDKPSIDNVDYIQDSSVPFESDAHGGEDVAVYASGPMSYLLSGTYEQSYIPHVMMYAACIGENKDHCARETNSAAWLQLPVNLLFFTLSVKFL